MLNSHPCNLLINFEATLFVGIQKARTPISAPNKVEKIISICKLGDLRAGKVTITKLKTVGTKLTTINILFSNDRVVSQSFISFESNGSLGFCVESFVLLLLTY
jgi:hypothetical protein